jgi:hypothetical protein
MPKSLIFVLVVFIWGSGQVLDSLVRYPIKVEYFIWASLGMPFLHFFFASVSGLMFVAAIVSLFRPRPKGFWLCLLAAVWSAMYGATATAIAIQDIENVRELYMLGREVRGLSIRPEAADLIFTASGMWSSYFIFFAFLLVVIAILFRQRQWFRRNGAGGGSTDH